MVQVTPLASVMLLVAFMVCIISEDAEDGKASEENTLRFQSLFLRARLDGFFHQALGVEDVDDGDGKKDEGDESDLEHAPIITHSPGDATPCSGFFVNLS